MKTLALKDIRLTAIIVASTPYSRLHGHPNMSPSGKTLWRGDIIVDRNGNKLLIRGASVTNDACDCVCFTPDNKRWASLTMTASDIIDWAK